MTGKSIVCVLAISCFAVAVQPPTRGQERKEKFRVSVEDIGKTLDLIGRLGVPLGEMMTIEGKWAFPAEVLKDNGIRFTVTSVNGRKLTTPFEFHYSQIRAIHRGGGDAIPDWQLHPRLQGKFWTLRGYEWGRFDREPSGWLEESGERISQSATWTRTFTPFLVGVVTRTDEVREVKK